LIQHVAVIKRVGGRTLMVALVFVALLSPAAVSGAVLLPRPAGGGDASAGPGRSRPAAGVSHLPVTLRESTVDRPAPPPPPPPPRPTSNEIASVPMLWQIYNLDCESAALQMALAHQGIQASQDQIMDLIGADLRGPHWDAGGMRWGDPYATFVGYVGGAEEYLTGYGTYFPPIVKAAAALGGRIIRAGEGLTPAEVYNAVLDGHPVVLWVGYDYVFHPRQDYTSFDGRPVLYAGPYEHAVTGVGVNEAAILVHDPQQGRIWLAKRDFEETYRTYNQMAVILS
jgi:uncharacterized protein YvpB